MVRAQLKIFSCKAVTVRVALDHIGPLPMTNKEIDTYWY